LETLKPLDFLDFRNYLIPASGFQSFQFRKVEAMLGLPAKQRITYGNYDYKSPFSEEQQKELVELENSASMFDIVEKWLERIPFLEFNEFNFSKKYVEAVHNMTERERNAILTTEYITEKEKEARIKMLEMQQEYIENAMNEEKHKQMMANSEVRLSFKATKSALLINLYRDKPILRMPYSILEKIVEIDESFIMWRFRHSQMVLRMLGRKMGTGGSSGHGYLKKTADEHHIFRDLHNVSTLLIPRSELPELPADLDAKLGFTYGQ
jgi:tryptophan 2,3-dioxygenase